MLFKKHRVLLILVIFSVLSTAFCTVRSEPDKIWNIRGKIVALAESLRGIPYHYGGTDIDGFDCSGLVFYLYDSFGVNIPRTAKLQGRIKGKIKFRNAEPGDILVFKTGRNQWHSGIFINKHYFIHSPNGKGFIRRESYSKYWKRKLKYALSVLKDY